MNSYEVSLEKFEGPLDLLIHLIQKNKIDIYDIPIAEITNQYLAHIEKWRELDMEVASEFVVMASKLLEIKSRMLLPRAKDEEEDEEDLKEKLVRQLIDFKNISTYLEERECAELHAVYKDPEYIPVMTQDAEVEINPEDIFKAYSNIFSLYNDEIEFKDFSQEIVREVFTVEEKIEYIEHQFELNRSGELHFSELFRKKVSRGEVVVTFLALLEMYKINNIRLFQNRVFQEIIIRQRTEE